MGKTLPREEPAEPPGGGSEMRTRMETRQELQALLVLDMSMWGTAVPTGETHLSLGYGCYWAVRQPGCE